MHTCPHCGRENNSPKPRCAECPADISIVETNTKHEQVIIEPEVVRSDDGRSYGQNQWSSGGTTFKTFSFSQGGSNFNMTRSDSCLPGLLTLVVAISIAVQYGILASIGFFVFYAIGSAINFFMTVRRTVRGQYISPWFGRIVVWLVSTFLAVSLAS